jgi:uncharacterized membrane protein YkgB
MIGIYLMILGITIMIFGILMLINSQDKRIKDLEGCLKNE